MKEPKFKIGDTAFRASYDKQPKWITCPDCLGSKHVKMILGDGTEVTIECGGCDPGGYEPSKGVIRQYDYVTVVKEFTVTGVNVRAEEINYELNNFGGGSYYSSDEKDLFETREEAQADGERQRREHEAEENKRFMAKTKNHHSWKWNATYHRRCIADLERQLEYHRGKVQVCAAKEAA